MGRRLPVNPQLGELEAIYREHHRRVRWVLRGRGVTDDAIDDLVHETFLVAFGRFGERDPATPIGLWIAGIARNVAFSHRRSFARRARATGDLPAPATELGPDEQIARRRAWHELEAFLGALDPAQREVFVLADVLGMRVPEVADVVDAPLNTLYSRLRLARRRFSERFGAEADRALRAGDDGDAPSRAQRQHGWLLLSTELFPAAAGPLATIVGSGLAKWMIAGAACAAAIVIAAPREEPPVRADVPSVADAVEPAAAAPAVVAVPAAIAAAPAPIPIASPIAAPPVAAARPMRPAVAHASAATDPLVATVDALRTAKQQVTAGEFAAALATIDALDRVDDSLRGELLALERTAACGTNGQARAERAHAASVRAGLSRSDENACPKKAGEP